MKANKKDLLSEYLWQGKQMNVIMVVKMQGNSHSFSNMANTRIHILYSFFVLYIVGLHLCILAGRNFTFTFNGQ